MAEVAAAQAESLERQLAAVQRELFMLQEQTVAVQTSSQFASEVCFARRDFFFVVVVVVGIPPLSGFLSTRLAQVTLTLNLWQNGLNARIAENEETIRGLEAQVAAQEETIREQAATVAVVSELRAQAEVSASCCGCCTTTRRCLMSKPLSLHPHDSSRHPSAWFGPAVGRTPSHLLARLTKKRLLMRSIKHRSAAHVLVQIGLTMQVLTAEREELRKETQRLREKMLASASPATSAGSLHSIAAGRVILSVEVEKVLSGTLQTSSLKFGNIFSRLISSLCTITFDRHSFPD